MPLFGRRRIDVFPEVKYYQNYMVAEHDMVLRYTVLKETRTLEVSEMRIHLDEKGEILAIVGIFNGQELTCDFTIRFQNLGH